MSHPDKVEVTINEKGTYYKHNGKVLGPYTESDINTLDFPSKAAEYFEVEPKEILRATLHNNKEVPSKDELLETLSTTIKKDDVPKLTVFLSFILTYTAEDQLNIALQSESSSGKSYIPLEISKYFPPEDVKPIGRISPTAFFHMFKQEKDQTDEDAKDQTDEDAIPEVPKHDFKNQIIIFLDSPSSEVLANIRTLLSHDKKSGIINHTTDRTQKMGYRVKSIEFVNFPTVCFSAVNTNLDDQERTRMILLSPETSDDKINESLRHYSESNRDRKAYYDKLDGNPQRKKLKILVRAIRDQDIEDFLIPDDLSKQILDEFKALTEHRKPRQQRDFKYLNYLIRGWCLFNFYNRDKPREKCLEVTQEDVDFGFWLFNQLSPANDLNLDPRTLEIFRAIIEPSHPDGILFNDILKDYFKKYHRPIGNKRLTKEVLPNLEEQGLLIKEHDANDKRNWRYIPIQLPVKQLTKPIEEVSEVSEDPPKGMDKFFDKEDEMV